MLALSRHGIAKLRMGDVSAYAGVSRGTAYRYFPNRDDLLVRLARREAERFGQQVWEVLESTPEGEERLRIVVDFAVRLGRDHPLIQRLPESDPGFVLTSLRERFPELLDTFERLFAPDLKNTRLVREGVVTAEQLVGWITRMMVSIFLFPDPHPDEMAASMRAIYPILAIEPPRRSRKAKGRKRE
jgi:AcrR family transcriptional regulator